MSDEINTGLFGPPLTPSPSGENGNSSTPASARDVLEVEAGYINVPDDSDAAPVESGSTKPRPYQRKCKKSVLAEEEAGIEDTLVVMATGLGKSVVIGDLTNDAESKKKTSLIIVHRDELVNQLERAIARFGIPVLREKAEDDAFPMFGVYANTVIASNQTLKGDRLARWPRDSFDRMITDECHRSLGQTYRDIYRHFNTAFHTGFTATADRADGQNIGQVYQTVAFEYHLPQAIEDGWLVRVESLRIKTDPPVDLRSLRVSPGNDFTDRQLEEVVQNNIGTMVNALKRSRAMEGRRTIAFTPLVESARALSDALNDIGISADWISGERQDRSQVIQRHRNGEFQVLCNCMVLVEGYDDPEVSCILICRPTKSRGLYSQMVGRGTRPFPSAENNTKENCLIIDFAYITDKLKLACPVDLYDNSEMPAEVKEIAREIMENSEATNPADAIEQAEQIYEERQRVRIKERAVRFTTSRFDPLDAVAVLGIRQNFDMLQSNWFKVKQASERQVGALRSFGINAPDEVPFVVADKLLKTCFVRKKIGLATTRQVGALIRLGMEPGQARRTRAEVASQYIDQHKTW